MNSRDATGSLCNACWSQVPVAVHSECQPSITYLSLRLPREKDSCISAQSIGADASLALSRFNIGQPRLMSYVLSSYWDYII